MDTEVVELSDVAACGDSTRSALIAAVERAAEGGDPTVDLSDTPDGGPVDTINGRFEPTTVSGERFVVGLFSDATDRPRQRERLERYEAILDSLDDAVYATAPDGTIEYVNGKYASMKGVDREELLGTNIYEWADEETAGRAKEIRRQIRAGDRDVGSLEYEFPSVDGETTPTEIRFVEMSRDAEAAGGAGVIRDISERRSYERRLERQNERLAQFASVVSHGLRNPLNVAAGRLDLAREVCDTEHLDDVADAHDRMAELIDGLLMLAQEGDDIGELEPVDLASLAEVCWGSVETDDATLDVDVDRPIRTDRGRLQRLLENVIRNSVEHGSTGPRSHAHGDSVEHGSTSSRTQSGDSVEHSSTSNRTKSDDVAEHSPAGSQAPPDNTVEHAGDSVRITIGSLVDASGFYLEDDGPGIPPEQRESVFEMGTSTDPDGTGFGLSIVEQIAEAHGWSVSVTDAEGGGARFEFSGVDFASE